MRLLLYTKALNGAGKRLRRNMASLVPEKGIEICRSKERLLLRLRQPRDGLGILIFSAGDRKELSELLSLRAFFLDICIILVLPDRKKQTALIAHKLRPRFITYADSSFSDFNAVLKKILR